MNRRIPINDFPMKFPAAPPAKGTAGPKRPAPISHPETAFPGLMFGNKIPTTTNVKSTKQSLVLCFKKNEKKDLEKSNAVDKLFVHCITNKK